MQRRENGQILPTTLGDQKGMTIHIGTSGFSYNDWAGVFYPEDIRQNEWLSYYAEYFSTTELNVTFYRTPGESVFKSWYKKTGDGFLFSVKGSRFITHLKKLRDVDDSVGYFFSRSKILKEKLGPVLWQLPPFLKPDIKVFTGFLELLKQYRHPLHAFEFRNPLWAEDKDITQAVMDAGATVCIADWKDLETGYMPGFSFYYIRRHGPGNAPQYAGSYAMKDIRADAKLVQKNMKGKDVFIYYNNDLSGFAVKNALALKKLLAEDK